MTIVKINNNCLQTLLLEKMLVQLVQSNGDCLVFISEDLKYHSISKVTNQFAVLRKQYSFYGKSKLDDIFGVDHDLSPQRSRLQKKFQMRTLYNVISIIFHVLQYF